MAILTSTPGEGNAVSVYDVPDDVLSQYAVAGDKAASMFPESAKSAGAEISKSGANAVKVPAKYLATNGDDYTGLPPKAPDANTMPGADSQGYVALDVDISMPGVSEEAKQRYEQLIKDFPDTLSASQAKKKMDEMPKGEQK